MAAAATSRREALLARKREFLMPCYYTFYREPVWIVRASGARVYDEDGRSYLDAFSGVGVVNCGHACEPIQSAAHRAARLVDHTTTLYLTEPMIELAERLAAIAPGGLRKTFFCSSGSEANEAAALVAALATGRRRFLALDRGLHGRTLLTMNLTGLEMWRTDPSLASRVTHLPTPACGRCPFGLERESCALHCADRAIERIDTEGSETFAAMFVEPVLGNGGIIPLPEGYLARLAPALRERGIALVADEMQTGFGRTGRWFGVEHDGVEPDLMTVAKALGNGAPIGAVLATERFAAAYTRPGASTFGGNGYSVGAALATLRAIEERDLAGRAARLGAWMIGELRERLGRRRAVGEVRGRGLMIGVEIVAANGAEDATAADAILESMRERGFLVGKTGPARNVVTIMPPLIVDRDDLEALIVALDESLDRAGAES